MKRTKKEILIEIQYFKMLLTTEKNQNNRNEYLSEIEFLQKLYLRS